MSKNFPFEEALSFMKCGFKVLGPGNRLYSIENNTIVCYPLPTSRPRQKRVEVKLNAEAILSNEWSLYESNNN